MIKQLKYGTNLDVRDGKLLSWIDRNNTILFEGLWDDEKLIKAEIRTPDNRQIKINCSATTHPTLGRCDTLSYRDQSFFACFQSVDWHYPKYIPPLDDPTLLPPGAGTTILNVISIQCLFNGIESIRYCGPYPTGALFDCLMESFNIKGGLNDNFKIFTQDVENKTLKLMFDEVAVDFYPAPYERILSDNGICVQLNDGLEKAYINGSIYYKASSGAHKICKLNEGYEAFIEIAGRKWAAIAEFNMEGELIHGPFPSPNVNKKYNGKKIPDSIKSVISDLLVAQAPAMMKEVINEVLTKIPITTEDIGDRLSLFKKDEIVLHSIFIERIIEEEKAEIFYELVGAIEPIVQKLAQTFLKINSDNYFTSEV